MTEWKIVFMGTPEFAIPALEYLVASDYRVKAVYTRRDKATGRGQVTTASPIKNCARRLNLPVIQPISFNTPDTVKELSILQLDLIVVAAYGQILPPEVLAIPRFGCLNIHPSLLPRYRGVSPVPAAILAGDEFSGVSIMLLDAGTDTGPILSQAQIPVLSSDTTASLTDKLAMIGARMLLEVIPRWIAQQIKPQPQDHSQATYCQKLTKEDGVIDWRLPANNLWRRVRALYPWPGAYTTWRGKQLKIIDTNYIAEPGPGPIGSVIALRDRNDGFGVITGEGVLEVHQVQLEGKRAMPAVEFIRGQRGLIGSLLPN